MQLLLIVYLYLNLDLDTSITISYIFFLTTSPQRTVIYSGAGISTSAGIGQAARSGQRKMTGGATTEAAPTAAHLALVSLYNRWQIYIKSMMYRYLHTFTSISIIYFYTRGLVQTWVQQNHDGLPQKAGWPQEDIIEIHGSW